MRLLFLGDSITQGSGASCLHECYVSVVGRKLGCEAVNYGIGGTRIAKQKKCTVPHVWDMDFQLRAGEMYKEADRVFVFGGTNDYGHGDSLLGEYDVKDPYTFYGGVRNLVEKLAQLYGKEKLCFILPLRRYNDEKVARANGAPLAAYVAILKEVLEKQGVDYIDLYENGFAKPLVNTGDEWTVDGLHPNDRGHEFVADKICEYVRKKTS